MTQKPYSREMEELSEKWMNGTITPEERDRLFEWFETFDDSELVLDPGQARVFQQLKKGMPEDIRRAMGSQAVVRKMSWRRVAVAAAVLVLATGGGYFAFQGSKASVPVVTVVRRAPAGDVLPGSDKAVLELGDGSQVVLDSTGSGGIRRQGGAEVVKTGVEGLKYTAVEGAGGAGGTGAVVYNRLTTPKGGQYRLELQDGTKVWLNAGSSIRYPTAFMGTERRVEIRGEAYFQVAQNAQQPFRVSVEGAAGGSQEIEVLGTEFNVNGYADEPDARTTLVDGGVRVVRGDENVVLKPLQQAVGSAMGLKKRELADLEQVVAWKSGAFGFEEADVPEILRQIARWYDVEVVYAGKMSSDRFTGRIPRNTSLAGVLKILNISGVRLEAENKKIVVRSN
ncbi:MAG TPA: FecR domain-containing protein [Puia sp.]|uniref:FecR family protein n=1 Tax=Puia sp. TaxID=2045100 RepID=UPI002BFD1CCB|nr:FecR domain-containing protein [Puia sp.]HVU94041.1 FecR domain-containing protein [Puia sp.]